MIEEKKPSLHPTSESLCRIYNELFEKSAVSFPLSDIQISKLDSVVKTVYASYWGFKRYPTKTQEATALFCYIIKDHPVVDGNKRLAVLTLEVCCITNQLILSLPPHFGLDELAVSVEASKISMDEIISLTHQILFE